MQEILLLHSRGTLAKFRMDAKVFSGLVREWYMRLGRTLIVLVTAISTTAVVVGSAGQAFAGTSETRVVSSALANTQGVEQTATSEKVAVTVPQNGRQRVALKGKNGGSLSIGLPNRGGSARKTSRGAMTYASGTGTTDAVVRTAEGVQMLTVVKSRKAPTSYTYDMGDDEVRLTPEGGAVIADGAGRVVAAVPPAWAKDANGTSVPTRFTADGKSLTQIVEHRRAGVVYPVVADPIVIWLMGVTVYCFVAGSYEARNLRGQPWWVWWWGMALACLPL